MGFKVSKKGKGTLGNTEGKTELQPKNLSALNLFKKYLYGQFSD